MEIAKIERKEARRLFTRYANNLEKALDTKNILEVHAAHRGLRDKYEFLNNIENRIYDFWINNPDRDERAFEDDMDTVCDYKDRWNILDIRVKEFTKEGSDSENSCGTIKKSHSSASSEKKRRRFKLPILELPKFDGDIKNWISFWGQFKKIHLDDELDEDDKFQYLLQSMEYGTCARELVASFPPSGKNYKKAVEELKDRFARDELIIEYYVRELLKLILQQAKGYPKMNIRSLYDQLMTKILALETLGVTRDKYAAFLYPIVESALPEETLRAWNRFRFHSSGNGELLSQLLQFVKHEAESEDRINLARKNFSCPNTIPSTACFSTTKINESLKQNELKQREEKPCLWCEKFGHTSSECTKAMEMTLEKRKDYIKNKKACFVCLKVGHSYKKCWKFPKCHYCRGRHYTILCEEIEKINEEKKTVSEEATVLNQLATMRELRTVLLQTVRVKIFNKDKSLTLRAMLDSGAQRSFVKTEIAEKLGLIPTGQEEVSHRLFGGVITRKQIHKSYLFEVTNLDGSYVLQMEALEQKTICNYLSKIKNREILSSLKEMGIIINDAIDNMSEVSLLVGSDILGSLIKGRRENLNENLVAVETKLGWTLQGPIKASYCATVSTSNTLSCTFDVEDLWKLETLGIKDLPEVKKQSAIDLEIMDRFRSTIKIDDENRYEVRLPWKTIVEDYNDVFDEWRKDGIIERVIDDDFSCGHYLPHHAVINESILTTKIRPVFDASASQRGVSLNSSREKACNLIELIPPILIRFRKGSFGVTADIKKAFLQISLHKDDRNYLKFLWWEEYTSEQKIEWRFIPPKPPWWGGYWKRLLRSMKDLTRKIIGKAALKLPEVPKQEIKTSRGRVKIPQRLHL